MPEAEQHAASAGVVPRSPDAPGSRAPLPHPAAASAASIPNVSAGPIVPPAPG
jgi:hypothetical protein